MKKLMIAIASAAALVGVTKADFSPYTSTFESFDMNHFFNANTEDVDGQGNTWWSITNTAESGYAIVTNTAFNGSSWTNAETSAQALYIDTSDKLTRKVNSGNAGAESFASDAIFFDGYVQFTATDVLPVPEAGDKLVVWLYGGDSETGAETYEALGLGSETKVTTNLVITAGLLDIGGTPTVKHYLVTNSVAEIEPNSWHRLTIKSFVDAANLPKFSVWLDETNLASSDVTAFPSLVRFSDSAAATITSVSFEGTGAIDDLGFTKTAPDFAQEAVAETFTLTVTAEGGSWGLYSDYDCTDLITATSPATLTVGGGNPVYVSFQPEIGTTVVGATLGSTTITPEIFGTTYYYTLDVSGAQSGDTLAFVITTTGGQSEVPSYDLTLTAGTGTTLSAIVDGQTAGATVQSNKTVTITAAISDATAYENLVVTVGGVDVTSLLVNGSYSFTMEANTTVATSATEKQQETYPTYLDGKDAAYKTAYNTWKTTYGADTESAYETAFLLNIDPATADQTLEPVSITLEGGKVVITANKTLTTVNGKVYVKSATTLAGLASAEWVEATLSEGAIQVTPGNSDTTGFYKIKVDF